MSVVETPTTALNAPPGDLGQPIKLLTNTFGIGVLDDVIIYVYEISICFQARSGKTVVITKKGKDDYVVNSRKEWAVKAYQHLLSTCSSFFGVPHACWYDGQSLLFSRKNFFENTDEQIKHFEVQGDVIDPSLAMTAVSFDIRPSARCSFNFNPSTVASLTANPNLLMNDHFIFQFLELVINQYAIMHPERHKVFENGKAFMCEPESEGFTQKDTPSVGDGKKLGVGTKKSLRAIDGPRGRGYCNPAMVIDAMKVAFHEPISLIVKAHHLTKEEFKNEVSEQSLKKLQTCLKGLACSTAYGDQKKTIEIYDISKHTAANYDFDMNGTKVKVQQYFENKYNLTLNHPNAPLAIARVRGQLTMYPMECLQVVPFTRVTIPQQTPEQSALTTRACAVPPPMRKDAIKKGAKALQIFDPQNDYIANAGIKVFPKPIMCNARVLPVVNLVYGGGRGSQAIGGKWRPGRYLVPAKCDTWAAYVVSGRPDDLKNLEKFISMFHEITKEKGMAMRIPAEIKAIRETQVEAVVRYAAANHCKFVLVVTPDGITTLHKKMKLWERDLEMVIQDVRLSTCFNVAQQNKKLTLENIIHKTNIKLGGLNYAMDLSQFSKPGQQSQWICPGRLILGIGMSHPPPGIYGENLPPTVVGFSANFKENHNEFVGDYVYQEGRKVELVDVIPAVLKKVIDLYRNSHNSQVPNQLIMYRSGIDEGSFANILLKEIPAMRNTLAELEVNLKLVYIVVQRDQPLRFFLENIPEGGRVPQQNIPPGVVCDVNVVHPAQKQFYLNSHTTIQGSASTPRYTVLVDDLELSMNEVEGITYGLSHGLQIITATVSLPAPVFIANEYAERGSYLYTEYMARMDEGSRRVYQADYDHLNKNLSYYGTSFSNMRVNA